MIAEFQTVPKQFSPEKKPKVYRSQSVPEIYLFIRLLKWGDWGAEPDGASAAALVGTAGEPRGS